MFELCIYDFIYIFYLLYRQEIALLQLQFQQFGGAAIVNGSGSKKGSFRTAPASDTDTAADGTNPVNEATQAIDGVDGNGEVEGESPATICTDPRCERWRLQVAQKNMAEMAAVKSKAEEKVRIYMITHSIL